MIPKSWLISPTGCLKGGFPAYLSTSLFLQRSHGSQTGVVQCDLLLADLKIIGCGRSRGDENEENSVKIPHLPDEQPATITPRKEQRGSDEGTPASKTRSITEGEPSYVPLAAVDRREGRMVRMRHTNLDTNTETWLAMKLCVNDAKKVLKKRPHKPHKGALFLHIGLSMVSRCFTCDNGSHPPQGNAHSRGITVVNYLDSELFRLCAGCRYQLRPHSWTTTPEARDAEP
jgi:hypothetical protein